jgi:hypothetical protein
MDEELRIFIIALFIAVISSFVVNIITYVNLISQGISLRPEYRLYIDLLPGIFFISSFISIYYWAGKYARKKKREQKGYIRETPHRKWLSVVGVLEDYSIAEIVEKKEKRRYFPRVVISYSVEGVQYTTTVIESSHGYDYREGAERFVLKKYINRCIKVFYDPTNPNNVRVESVPEELGE